MKPKIIFEDKYLIVLDKPAGWIVNEAITTKNTPVIQTWIKENFQFPISSFQSFRSGIVHRLDKETSGILVVAKTKSAFESLQNQFKNRVVIKTYLALVHGRLETKEGIIRVPLGRLPWNRERFGILPGGRVAVTKYRAIENYNKNEEEFTLAEFQPKTGRTHQIRVHAKHIKHPIVSDLFYTGRKRVKVDRKWCPRLFLHATEISLEHPKLKRVVSFRSELPKDLSRVISNLEKQP